MLRGIFPVNLTEESSDMRCNLYSDDRPTYLGFGVRLWKAWVAYNNSASYVTYSPNTPGLAWPRQRAPWAKNEGPIIGQKNGPQSDVARVGLFPGLHAA